MSFGGVRLEPRPPEQRLGARHELLWVKRLGEVVVCADLEADHLVGDLVSGREHDDRHLALLADLLADRQAVGAGKHDVEDHEVGLDLAEPGERLRPVPHSLDLVTLAGQVEAGELDDMVLVVDDHHLGAHGLAHRDQYISIPSSGCRQRVIEM